MIATPRSAGLAHAFKDTGVIARRNLMRNLRMPQLVLFATVQPVMFLLLFNYVFGGSIGRSIPAAAGGKYINYLVPGLLIQVAIFGSGQTALGLTEDLSKGVIDRFRSLPMARSAVLGGRTLSDLIRDAFVICLMLAVGFLIGFRAGVCGLPGPAHGGVRLDPQLVLRNARAFEAEPTGSVESPAADQDTTTVARGDVPEHFLALPGAAVLRVLDCVQKTRGCSESGIDRPGPDPGATKDPYSLPRHPAVDLAHRARRGECDERQVERSAQR